MIEQKRTFKISDMLLYKNIENSRFKKALGAKRAVRHCLEELLLKALRLKSYEHETWKSRWAHIPL
jgi:hypothetical protein